MFATLFVLNIVSFGIINVTKSNVVKLKRFVKIQLKQYEIEPKVYQIIEDTKKAEALQNVLDVDEAVEIEDRAIARVAQAAEDEDAESEDSKEESKIGIRLI